MKVSFRSNQIKVATLMFVSFITACSDDDSSNVGVTSLSGDFQAAIISVSASSSEISLANTALVDDIDTVEVDESASSYDIINGYEGVDLTDMAIASYGKNYYRIGRYLQDSITKYSYENPNQIEWQFSVNMEGETGSNPYDIVFVSEDKAYVIRYGADSILIIDPSVSFNDEDNFQIGSIDLSAYNHEDQNVPFMSAAVLHEGNLYVTMQVMNGDWVPGDAMLAIIDTTTDTEVETSGVNLLVKNPIDLDVLGDSLYVSGIGRYANNWNTPPTPAEYTGGIEKINLDDLSSVLLVDDGDAEVHPYSQINGLTLVSETKGYFQSYVGWQDNALYEFNPTTGAVVETPLTGLSGIDMRVAEVSLEGELWVGVGDDAYPEIQVIDPEDNSVIQTIYTDKTPIGIAFSGDLSN